MSPRAAVATAFLLLVVPATAQADGLPVNGPSPDGVAGQTQRFLALGAGHGTVLTRVKKAGGRPIFTRYVPFALEVPTVATDRTPGGLSHDGRTLVLNPPHGQRYPARRSAFYLVNTDAFVIKRVVRLRGDFAFDAISPDGATLYAIQLGPKNPLDYAVRAIDTASGRLLPKPIVDPRERDEAMTGYPLTRVTSPDGRFAYTLYAGRKLFIHALDTTRKTAVCIDLPSSLVRDVGQLSLRLNGRRLEVWSRGAPVAFVDPATRRVMRPVPNVARPPRRGGGSSAWLIAAASAAAVLLLAGVALVRRRLRPGQPPVTGAGVDEHLPGVEGEVAVPLPRHPAGVAEHRVDVKW